MNIFDFLTDDEIADAPEDPTMAFTYLVRIAQARLDERLSDLADMNESNNHDWDDARLGFMSTLISLGKTYEIAPFSTMEVPRYQGFQYDTFRQFKGDLDHYLAQLVMGNALRARRDSIKLSVDAKGRIRAHVHHIKDFIDRAEIPEAKRATLHRKLAEFEAALEKERLNWMAATRVVLEILSVSANVVGLAESDAFRKLLTNVMVTVAEEKAADDENRQLPPYELPKAILPPRTKEPKPREDFSSSLDDEIPF